ncbi:MAG: exopolyphosphatase [bacterium]|nr:exopolyphosphatase [bacterium]
MTAEPKTYRLVTRPGFDGLACAVLLRHIGLVGDVEFVHPKDVQDGRVALSDRDITANLPWVEDVHLAFDHHSSETIREKGERPNRVLDPTAPSTARLIWRHFGGAERFPASFADLLDALDKCDGGRLTEEEVLHPSGWVLLYFIVDIRTGLGRFKDYREETHDFLMTLVDHFREGTIEGALALPSVRERVDLYFEQAEAFRAQLLRCGEARGNILLLDMRREEVIRTGNRFMKYLLFPACNVCIQILWGVGRKNTVFSVGRSIFNRTSTANIGEILLRFGGGGHVDVGTCQVPNERADEVLDALLRALSG